MTFLPSNEVPIGADRALAGIAVSAHRPKRHEAKHGDLLRRVFLIRALRQSVTGSKSDSVGPKPDSVWPKHFWDTNHARQRPARRFADRLISRVGGLHAD
jgi:hypothetical protein